MTVSMRKTIRVLKLGAKVESACSTANHNIAKANNLRRLIFDVRMPRIGVPTQITSAAAEISCPVAAAGSLYARLMSSSVAGTTNMPHPITKFPNSTVQAMWLFKRSAGDWSGGVTG